MFQMRAQMTDVGIVKQTFDKDVLTTTTSDSRGGMLTQSRVDGKFDQKKADDLYTDEGAVICDTPRRIKSSRINKFAPRPAPIK